MFRETSFNKLHGKREEGNKPDERRTQSTELVQQKLRWYDQLNNNGEELSMIQLTLRSRMDRGQDRTDNHN